jgi:hypothetical protein
MMISRKFPVISRGVRTALKGACAARKRLFPQPLGQTYEQNAQNVEQVKSSPGAWRKQRPGIDFVG